MHLIEVLCDSEDKLSKACLLIFLLPLQGAFLSSRCGALPLLEQGSNDPSTDEIAQTIPLWPTFKQILWLAPRERDSAFYNPSLGKRERRRMSKRDSALEALPKSFTSKDSACQGTILWVLFSDNSSLEYLQYVPASITLFQPPVNVNLGKKK